MLNEQRREQLQALQARAESAARATRGFGEAWAALARDEYRRAGEPFGASEVGFTSWYWKVYGVIPGFRYRPRGQA